VVTAAIPGRETIIVSRAEMAMLQATGVPIPIKKIKLKTSMSSGSMSISIRILVGLIYKKQ